MVHGNVGRANQESERLGNAPFPGRETKHDGGWQGHGSSIAEVLSVTYTQTRAMVIRLVVRRAFFIWNVHMALFSDEMMYTAGN
jgi:hypothetical protein